MKPRSKEELLTKHIGGKHGDGGASGDQPSLRQGVGTGTYINSLILILGPRWWRNSGKNVENQSTPRIFETRGINRRKVRHQRWAHLARQSGARPAPGRARWPPNQGVAPPGPPSRIWKL